MGVGRLGAGRCGLIQASTCVGYYYLGAYVCCAYAVSGEDAYRHIISYCRHILPNGEGSCGSHFNEEGGGSSTSRGVVDQ